MRKAPNWRRFVHAFCLCNLPIEFSGSLSLPWKIAFPDGGDRDVEGDRVVFRRDYQNKESRRNCVERMINWWLCTSAGAFNAFEVVVPSPRCSSLSARCCGRFNRSIRRTVTCLCRSFTTSKPSAETGIGRPSFGDHSSPRRRGFGAKGNSLSSPSNRKRDEKASLARVRSGRK